MATTNIKLKTVPIQITDGTKYATVQSMHDKNFRWCDSATMPDKLNYQYSTRLNIGMGASIWIWNPTQDDTEEMSVSYTIIMG